MRFVEAGYIDDAAWARMKAGSLLRRGYGERRVSQALHAAGIEADLREAERERAAVGLEEPARAAQRSLSRSRTPSR